MGVGDEMTPDDVAEAPLECADRFAWRVALGELAFVEAGPTLWRWRIWVIAAMCRA